MNSNATVAAARKRRIFLVDDHPLVREGLANLINGQNDRFKLVLLIKIKNDLMERNSHQRTPNRI